MSTFSGRHQLERSDIPISAAVREGSGKWAVGSGQLERSDIPISAAVREGSGKWEV